ncbi:MAG TPA: EF-hand domain-containing protein [Rhodocyclaceae bacterium]|nr:EF-hand domain-containing protein [Rhodocyclaceae bacterium]
MSTSIGSATTYSSAYTSINLNRNKANTDKLAESLFSKLDTKNQGYISQSDLESAFSSVGSTSSSSSTSDSTSTADALFKKLDSDGDGKVTESELSSALQKAADQLSAQFDSQRVHGGGHPHGAGGPPPGPPPSDSNSSEDTGFTQDQLTAMANDSNTDTNAASLFSALAANFTAADSNGDGKITHDEAFAYKDSVSGASNSSSGTAASSLSSLLSTGSSSSDTSSSTDTASSEAQFLAQILKLAQSYGIFSADSSTTRSNSISVTA